MRILYVGNAQGHDNGPKFYMIPQKLLNGFTRNGHTVYICNDRDVARSNNILRSSKLGRRKANDHVISLCRDYEPELIVLGHCKHIANDTLHAIRSFLPDIKIVYRNVDPLHVPQNVQDIRSRVGVVDGIFVTTSGDALKQFEHPSTFVCYMPNPIDPSLETGRAFENEGLYDVFFAGNFLRHQHDHRRDLLLRLRSECADLRLGLFGSGLGTDCVFGQAYLDRLAQSRMGLCLNKTSDYYLYASDRMAQYLGQGLLAFIDRGPRFEDLFTDEQMAFYSDADELIDKIRYYAVHDDQRRAHARNGWEKGRRIFGCQSVASYIVEKTFDLPFSQTYAWI